jgi:hypothetical protein
MGDEKAFSPVFLDAVDGMARYLGKCELLPVVQ